MQRSALSATLAIALSLALPLGSGALANDQIYKCVDPGGATVLSDKPCAVIQGVPADATLAEPMVQEAPVQDNTMAGTATAYPAGAETTRHVVTKEYYKLPAADIDNGKWARKVPVTTAPRIDVATLKAAKLRLELSDRTASLD